MSKIDIRPCVVQQGTIVVVSGLDWPADAVVLTVHNEVQTPVSLLVGSHWNGHVVPDAVGAFLFKLATQNLAPGKYTVRAETLQRGGRADVLLTVEKRVREPDAPREKIDKPFLRGDDLKRRRLGKGVTWPAGVVDAAKKGWLKGGSV